MTQENVTIRVTDNGTKVVKRNIEDIGRASKNSQTSVDYLNRALRTLTGALGAAAIIRYADSFNRLQNRLAVVTNSTMEVAAATNDLYKVAQDTRTSFEDTVEMYTRMALGARELGVSQKELVRFTESVNKAVSLSGATAQEAKAGLIQLSQGMASGRLSGDELRSVLEQLPVVADVIAKQMGVTRGELRALGAEGKITGRTIIDAFEAAGDSLDERFAKKVPTIAESVTKLSNAMELFIGRLDQSLGFTRSFGDLATWVADNMDNIGAAVATLLPLLAILVSKAALGGVVALLGGIAAFIAANPFTAIFAAVGGYVVAVGQLDSEMDDLLKTMDRTATVGDKLKATAVGVRVFIETVWEDFPQWFSDLMERAVNMAVAQWSKLADKMKGAVTGLGESIDTAIGGGGQFFTNMFRDLADQFKSSNELDKQLEETENRLREFPDTVAIAAGRAQEAYRDALLEFSKANGQLSDISGTPHSPTDKEKKKGRHRTFQDEFDKLAGEIEILQIAKEADERERLNRILHLSQSLKGGLNDEQKEDLNNMLRVIQNLERQRDLYDEITEPQREYAQTVQALNVLFEDGEITIFDYNKKLDELNMKLLETSTTVEGGLLRGMLKIKEEFTDLSNLAENTLTNAIQGVEDAFVSMVSKGKVDFSSLIDSMIADLARLTIRSSITGPLASALGNIAGSFMGGGSTGGTGVAMQGSVANGMTPSSWMSGLSRMKFATGGEFTVGGSGGVDTTPVGFMATPGEKVYIRKPGERDPSSGTVVLAPNITIIDNVGVNVKTEQTPNQDGSFDMKVVIDQVSSQIAGEIRTGQSPLVGAVGDKFGLQPRPGGR